MVFDKFNKLLIYLSDRGSNTPPVYGLDATDVSQWKEKVHTPAVEILTAILKVFIIFILEEDLFLIYSELKVDFS
jgi:hypothetical protein